MTLHTVFVTIHTKGRMQAQSSFELLITWPNVHALTSQAAAPQNVVRQVCGRPLLCLGRSLHRQGLHWLVDHSLVWLAHWFGRIYSMRTLVPFSARFLVNMHDLVHAVPTHSSNLLPFKPRLSAHQMTHLRSWGLQEGPLVHSGAAIAANISHLPTCAIKKCVALTSFWSNFFLRT